MRVVPIAALLAVVALVAVVAFGGGEDQDRSGRVVHAVVDEATNLLEGQRLRDAGGYVGEVTELEPVQGGRKARVTMRIDEDRVWPLRKGARLTVRFSGTANFLNRVIEVRQGPASAKAIPEGATLSAAEFRQPVEFDGLMRAFDADTRRDLRTLVNRSGVALDKARPGMAASLEKAPAVMEEADAVLRDLGADSAALETLVRSTDRVVDAVHRADPGFGPMIQGAADTIAAVADRQEGVRSTLRRLPAAMSQVRSRLQQADGTLRAVADLAQDLDPGADQLRAISAPLASVLRTVTDVAPDAEATLATARKEGSQITGLLRRATDEAPRLTSILDQADTELACVRPYTPEIVGLLTTWGDWMSAVDGKDRYLRATVQNFLPASMNSIPYSAEDAKRLFPGVRYGFPRPPGFLAGQPWYLPECGAGEDAVDPSKDRENHSFNPLSKLPVKAWGLGK